MAAAPAPQGAAAAVAPPQPAWHQRLRGSIALWWFWARNLVGGRASSRTEGPASLEPVPGPWSAAGELAAQAAWQKKHDEFGDPYGPFDPERQRVQNEARLQGYYEGSAKWIIDRAIEEQKSDDDEAEAKDAAADVPVLPVSSIPEYHARAMRVAVDTYRSEYDVWSARTVEHEMSSLPVVRAYAQAYQAAEAKDRS